MNIEMFRDTCLMLPNTREGMPFEGFFHRSKSILVFYVEDKMFCLFDIDRFESCTIKCSPEHIEELKDKYRAVGNPFNLSPKYWISIQFNADMPTELLMGLVKSSYLLVVESLKKKIKEE
jgi:predicted DNA-binding protein (MmcQ/YjbR family)